MFSTNDNAGHVRINFTTNVALADKINPVAMTAEKPKVISTPVTMGGYRYPILEDMAQGRHFQILKARIAGEDDTEAQEMIDAVLDDSDTALSYVDAATLTVVQIDGWNEKLGDHGWTIWAGQKSFKRIKTMVRPFRLADCPERQ